MSEIQQTENTKSDKTAKERILATNDSTIFVQISPKCPPIITHMKGSESCYIQNTTFASHNSTPKIDKASEKNKSNQPRHDKQPRNRQVQKRSQKSHRKRTITNPKTTGQKKIHHTSNSTHHSVTNLTKSTKLTARLITHQ